MEQRDYETLLAKRLETLQRTKNDPVARVEVLSRCAEDTLYWFDNFAFGYDPRRGEAAEQPFIPYAGKQTSFIQYLDSVLKNPRDIFIDKPRDVGATVILMNWVLKHWLFDDGFTARVGSRKEDYVDEKGNPDTLFFKIDYTLERLPEWMLPSGFTDKNRTYLKLSRPDSNNVIVGESANPSFARGGRQTVVLFDEIGFWPWARAAWQSAGDVTNMRVAMTTPPDTGKASFAYKLLDGQEGKVEKFEFEYTDIPWKDSQWLKDQKERRSVEEFNREVNKSYSGTVEGKVYAVEWNLHVREAADIDYDPAYPLFISWDFGLDATSMIWWQKDYVTDRVWIIDCYENYNKTPDFYIPFVTGEIVSGNHIYELEDIHKIRLHRDWRKDITHYGDPNVKARAYVNKKSAQDVFNENGIYIQSKDWGGRKHRELRDKAKVLMRRLSVNSVRCQPLVEAITMAQYPRRNENSQSTTEQDKPVHDDTSHFRTAFEYFADNEPSREKKMPVAPKKGKGTSMYRPHRTI